MNSHSQAHAPSKPLLLLLLQLLACSSPGQGRCYLEPDFQNLPRPRQVESRSSYREAFRALFSGFLTGVGDRYQYWPQDGGDSVKLHRWVRQNGAPVNAQAIWLTRNWEEDWLRPEDLDSLVRDGVVPVLLLAYFEEDISRDYVLKHRKEWYRYLAKVAALAAVDEPVLVVLEPEFNDTENGRGKRVASWTGFNEVMIDGIYLLRSLAPNLLVGLCAGDFGEQELEPIVGEAVYYSDFVAFQEMRASTRPHGRTDVAEDVSDRALAYAEYLKEAFDKPILLAYAAASTYDPQGAGWEQHQAAVIDGLFQALPELQGRGVFGLLYFQLLDDPLHTGYFGEAEKHFGLVDTALVPKPAWEAFSRNVVSLEGILFDPKR